MPNRETSSFCGIVGIDRMRRCRWHKSFCLDDDCTNPRHLFSSICDGDAHLSEACSSCGDFEEDYA